MSFIVVDPPKHKSYECCNVIIPPQQILDYSTRSVRQHIWQTIWMELFRGVGMSVGDATTMIIQVKKHFCTIFDGDCLVSVSMVAYWGKGSILRFIDQNIYAQKTVRDLGERAKVKTKTVIESLEVRNSFDSVHYLLEER